ncbi:MAG: response regulator transcription factor [Bacillota bacterium]|nr:response regulator transcription factor [Bacillota bacterium]
MSEYKPLILMVEDNPDVLRLNSRALRRAGYEVACAETLAQAEAALAERAPDVAVLDILLPDGNGLEWLPRLKELSDGPVLFLSSKNEHTDILAGIRAGGDDYLPKPYMLEELLVRVEALWRRERLHREKTMRLVAQGAESVIERGPLRLDALSGVAYLNGEDLLLNAKEFALLLLLARSEGRYLSAGTLYEIAWGQPMAGDSSAVKVTLSRLRKKLEGSGFCIGVRRGDGYILMPEE